MSILQTLDKQYINGEWRDGLGAKTLQDINPYNGEVIAEFKMANLEDIDAAYKAAANAKNHQRDSKKHQAGDGGS
ncbi:aldehyde dehydrogenase family protein [Brevibacillus formosus]|uniref:aldehyde dehydrogenase family protein n=1 Tax=Brevibacillus formosus TaxID=54913 RepID=UPI003F1A8DD7